ncbi:MAG: hypothetical protein JST09_05705 [Bacteroidetes bacterium]|nr:hypothetical protein [Bacteroidota bacterium]MBS1608927.1 hypothetical protein [Bacteroidota bacterium]
MKKITLFFFLCISLLLYCCKPKEDKKEEGFFPVLSFLKSQVAHIDTSLYQITKLTSRDSTWDTSYIKREEFHSYANDFLTLPDLTDKTISAKYEESKFFDASLNRAIITYTPKDKSEEIQREEVTIEPDAGNGDKVKNIIVDKLVSTKDSSITKRMLWTVNESFQVTSIIQKPGHEDSTKTLKITWQ